MEKDVMAIEGFSRVRIRNSDGTISGDSGWVGPNMIVNLGFQDYLIDWLLGDTDNGKSVTHMALGEGSQPGAADTDLESEVEKREEITGGTSIVDSKTAQFVGTFSSDDSFVTATENISNIGLFNTSSGGTIFAGNTYASSSCATNQNVECTYQIRFATA